MSSSPNGSEGVDATLEAARTAHAAGKAERTITLCQHALALDPRRAVAWHLLGVQAMEMGQPEQGIKMLARAVELAPASVEYRNDLGVAFLALGRAEPAARLFAHGLELDPESVDLRDNLAVALLRLEQFADAETHLRWLADHRPTPSTYADLGQALARTGRAEEAITWLERALREDPEHPTAPGWLGLALAQRGRVDEAIARCHQAIERAPQQPENHTNLGEAERIASRHDGAAAAYQRALELGDGSARVRIGLSLALLRLGRHDDAWRWAEEAIGIDPSNAGAQLAAGVIQMERGRMSAAAAHLENAVAVDPGLRAAHVQLAKVYPHLGDSDKARTHAERALAIADSPGLRVRAATLLPAIYQSKQQLLDARARYQQNLDGLLADGITVENPLEEIGATNFFLAYQGMDDRPLQDRYARLFPNLPAELPLATPGKSERRRVGFYSRFFTRHAVSMCYGELIAALGKRDDLEVVLLYPSGGGPPPWAPGRTVAVPQTLEAARQVVAREALDVLVYPDLGMEPFSYFLAFTRLAPVQCAMAGHPVTTGIPTVDCFVSAAMMEPPDAQAHYSERLIRLTGMISHVGPPEIDAAPVQKTGGSDGTQYCCPMLLQKLHPDFDAAVGEILRRDRRGRLVLFRDERRPWQELLSRRFQRTIPDVLDRVHFIDPLPMAQFTTFLRSCDVLLDTFHFGAGTTLYAAFAAGTPMVTWPAPFMRGRMVAGAYARLGIDATVARSPEDYVERAVRLGTDRDLRDQLRAEITQRAHILFHDRTVVDDFARFLTTAPLA